MIWCTAMLFCSAFSPHEFDIKQLLMNQWTTVLQLVNICTLTFWWKWLADFKTARPLSGMKFWKEDRVQETTACTARVLWNTKKFVMNAKLAIKIPCIYISMEGIVKLKCSFISLLMDLHDNTLFSFKFNNRTDSSGAENLPTKKDITEN